MTATISPATQSDVSADHRASMDSFSLVLPAHNEAGNIELVVSRALQVLPAFFDTFEVIVVDE